MSKLLALKQWVTVADAANYLSDAFDEDVSESDVLHLAIEGRLQLSVHFVNHAKAKEMKLLPLEEADSFLGIPVQGHEPYDVVLGIPWKSGRVLAEVKNSRVKTISGIWDLPMVGNERIDVEKKYQSLTGGPDVTLVCLDGTFVENSDGQIYQLQEFFDGDRYQKDHPSHNTKKSYPAGGLPEDAVLVVRTEVLRGFAAREKTDDKKDNETPLERRERLSKRRGELIAQGTRNFLQTLAKEEGVSPARIKQILSPPKSMKADWYKQPIRKS